MFLRINKAAIIEIQARARAGDDPTVGNIGLAIRFFKDGHANDGHYQTAAGAWQAGAAVVTSTQGDFHAHQYVLPDTALVTGMEGGRLTVRAADAAAIGPTADFAIVIAGYAAVPTGLRQITIHVQDGVAAPISGVHISVYDATNVTFLTRGDTDTNGNLLVALDDATYKLRLAKGTTGFTVPETMTITKDETFTFTGTPFVAPTAVDPGDCAVYGTIWDSENKPWAGVQIDAYATTPQFVGDITMGMRLGTVMTDALGKFTIDLGKGVEVRFKVVDAGIDWTKTVPNAANQDVKDWT